MIPYDRLDHIPYGGDYNPEQWPREVWDKDMELLKEANINIVTLNVFSWAKLQPSEDAYDFNQLDEIMDLVEANGLKVCLATSTAAHPAWMAHRYPDILRTDFEGRKRKFGGRHNSCPSSPTYHKYAPLLARKLANRYKNRKSIVAWHISNEYGGDCYCDNCEKGFRSWLQEKYGTIDNVNKAWNTAFWGHTFYDWDEIVAPNVLSEHFEYYRTMFQGISLDYRRFQSDAILNCYKLEKEQILLEIPDASITTNMMGFYRELDYFKWGKEMDFISWDNYPSNEDSYSRIAMSHDIMRGVGGGKPFMLMEQTPSVTNWLPYNALKRPGVMRLWSYQAMAHGADSVMFFQMRRSVGACEKYHGAVIDHEGTNKTRVFREISALGRELKNLGNSTLSKRTKSQVAIMFDWDNWWAIDYSAGPSVNLNYVKEVGLFYDALRRQNYNADFVSVDDDFEGYKIVIAPVLYMVKGNNDEKIRSFVKGGGRFITTFFSGFVQENDLVTLGGYPGKLRDILGIWVEEEDALPESKHNSFAYKGRTYKASLLCDLLHLKGAKQLDEAGYIEDFYKGMPVVTKNSFGDGKAYYIASSSEAEFYEEFIKDICDENDIKPELETPREVEVTSRGEGENKIFFVMNHSDESKEISLPNTMVDIISGKILQKGKEFLDSKDVWILRKSVED